MRTILLILCFLGFIKTGTAQQNEKWGQWSWLTGEWVGEGSGQPGTGGGTFSFQFDLDRNILVRKSHSEYPATGNKPLIIHNDLMIVYPDMSGTPSKAIYFDNEGHTINYTIAYGDKSIILTSDKMPNVPIFRLTYSLLDKEVVNTKFEMSQDGEKFMVYIEGKSKRANK
jgi:hypothetical protein